MAGREVQCDLRIWVVLLMAVGSPCTLLALKVAPPVTSTPPEMKSQIIEITSTRSILTMLRISSRYVFIGYWQPVCGEPIISILSLIGSVTLQRLVHLRLLRDLQGAGLFWRTCSAKPPKSSSEIILHKAPGEKKILLEWNRSKNKKTNITADNNFILVLFYKAQACVCKEFGAWWKCCSSNLLSFRPPAVLTIYLLIYLCVHYSFSLINSFSYSLTLCRLRLK